VAEDLSWIGQELRNAWREDQPVDPCIRGCVWIDDDGEEQPSEASYGRLCSWCFLRLRDHLVWAPGVVGVLVAGIVPGLGAVKFDAIRVSGSRQDRDVFSEKHAELASNIEAAIVSTCGDAVRMLGIKGPDAALGKATRAGKDAVETRDELRELTSWMLTHLESIAYTTLAGEAHDDIVEPVREGRKFVGLNEARPKRARGACIVCGTHTVEVTWTDFGNAEVRCRTCHMPAPAYKPELVIDLFHELADEASRRSA
jgi:hypothetical protein